MKCRNCNAELPDELHFTFCGYCGERLVRERKKKNEIKIPTPRKRGQRWYVDLRREGVTVIEDTEAEAKAKAIAIRAGFIDAKKKQPALTLRAAIDNYIGDRDNALSPATVRGYITIKNNAFAPVMDTDIFSVRNWQSVVNVEAGRGISAKTLQNEWGLVKSVLDKNKIDTSAVSSLPQVVQADLPWLDYEQIKIFLDAVRGDEFELAALFALHSLRRSEVLALTPRHIENDIIHVSGSVVYDKDYKLVTKKENKNTSSKRDVNIVIPRLFELLTDCNNKGNIEPFIKCAPDTLRKHVNRACVSAGLPEVGMHGLRRSFASLAYHLGWSERQTMAMGGWADLGTVHRRYIKLAEKDKNADIEKMKAFYNQ